MRNRRSLQMTLVRTPSNDGEQTDKPRLPRLNPAEIKVLKDAAKGVGAYILLTVVVIKSADAICEIAVNAAPKR